jgi:hypothetical protein
MYGSNVWFVAKVNSDPLKKCLTRKYYKAQKVLVAKAKIQGSSCFRIQNSTKGRISMVIAYSFFTPTGIYVRLDHPDIFNFLQEALTNSEGIF